MNGLILIEYTALRHRFKQDFFVCFVYVVVEE